jgi:hypothetical protein
VNVSLVVCGRPTAQIAVTETTTARELIPLALGPAGVNTDTMRLYETELRGAFSLSLQARVLL